MTGFLKWQIEAPETEHRLASLQEVNKKILKTVSEIKVSEASQCQHPTFPSFPAALLYPLLVVQTYSHPFPFLSLLQNRQ